MILYSPINLNIIYFIVFIAKVYLNFTKYEKFEGGFDLSIGFKQEKVLRVNGEFIRFLRLAFLPKERFDAFTINSILNDFEFDYLTNPLDVVVENALNEICRNLLAQYPTDIVSDRMSLTKVERKKKKILRAMKKNRNRNLTEMKMLRDDKALLDREALVLKYRIREKEFVRKCTKMTITLSSEYLKSAKRRTL